MNTQALTTFIDKTWDDSIIHALMKYIHIPNKSPLFDPQWRENGYMDEAVKLMVTWCKEQKIPDLQLEVVTLPNRTPLIFIEIPGDSKETILLYGHLDKQPEMAGWNDGLAPWKAVLKGDKLYGRGGADDGYAIFSAVTAIKALRNEKIPHARCVIVIEACEESGSYDLPFYMDALEERIGNPDLVICLDSGCGNYEQLWMTTSLRGFISGVLYINVLEHGIHSGMGSGIVPSVFLVLRQLLDRIEDVSNGAIKLQDLQVKIPAARQEQATQAATILKDEVIRSLPFVEGVHAVSNNVEELILNRTWRPALSIVGMDGFPGIANAGNVTLPQLTLKLSMRIPPTTDADKAAATLKNALENSPPFNAHVQFEVDAQGGGWDAPEEKEWLHAAAQKVSKAFYGKDAAYSGEGGSIPFMGMLGKKFPQAQFMVTGVLGPASNAHGPNEFLHIPMAKKLTACVAGVIAEHFKRK